MLFLKMNERLLKFWSLTKKLGKNTVDVLSPTRSQDAMESIYSSHLTPSGIEIIMPAQNPSPEVLAMLQAKYSRDPKTVKRHLEDIATPEKAKNFMNTFYVGYGHRSIGRCGFVTLFVEGISILAASILVHSPKFNGQECSTRYLDFFTQGHYVPDGMSAEAIQVREELMNFYREGLEVTIRDLESRFPWDESVPKPQYLRTIKAKAFDIMRGFLPVSCRTNVAITMTLMDFQDHVLFLMGHLLDEVREVGRGILSLLMESYPSSFRAPKDEEVALFSKLTLETLEGISDDEDEREVAVKKNINIAYLYDYFVQQTRLIGEPGQPKLIQFPREYEQAASVMVRGTLDFGSWRDIHRHTSADHSLVVLEPKYFESWYLESLPEEIRERGEALVRKCQGLRGAVGQSSLQYVTPLGFKVPVVITTGIRSLHYIIHLRSQDTVHPTLRNFILQVANSHELGDINFDLPKDAKEFNLRRGNQTIVEKGEK